MYILHGPKNANDVWYLARCTKGRAAEMDYIATRCYPCGYNVCQGQVKISPDTRPCSQLFMMDQVIVSPMFQRQQRLPLFTIR